MEQFIRILIYIHAFFGGIALLTGLVSILVKKGNKTHRKTGIFFYYSMLTSGITAMTVALLPKHEDPFLFAVGIFSLYFVLTGYRALRFKNRNPRLIIDKFISITMMVTGVLMILLPIILHNNINLVLLVFAIVGIIFSIRDFMLFSNLKRLRKNWLKLHLGKMLGGYISATTAFVVVNNFFSSYYGWFIPGIIGSLIIAYWMRKINLKKV
jgi:uncharacterized membrane protein